MKNIMVVYDSKIMRNIIKKIFSQLKIPCEFVEVGDGEEALKQLEANRIDLILLDWNMPKMSGLDFLKKVRDMAQYQTLPIIMITSEAAKYNIIEALKNGATDYIIKPINEKNLVDKMAKLDFLGD
jgi:two-component system chemotaxis response regulator CheY